MKEDIMNELIRGIQSNWDSTDKAIEDYSERMACLFLAWFLDAQWEFNEKFGVYKSKWKQTTYKNMFDMYRSSDFREWAKIRFLSPSKEQSKTQSK